MPGSVQWVSSRGQEVPSRPTVYTCCPSCMCYSHQLLSGGQLLFGYITCHYSNSCEPFLINSWQWVCHTLSTKKKVLNWTIIYKSAELIMSLGNLFTNLHRTFSLIRLPFGRLWETSTCVHWISSICSMLSGLLVFTPGGVCTLPLWTLPLIPMILVTKVVMTSQMLCIELNAVYWV